MANGRRAPAGRGRGRRAAGSVSSRLRCCGWLRDAAGTNAVTRSIAPSGARCARRSSAFELHGARPRRAWRDRRRRAYVDAPHRRERRAALWVTPTRRDGHRPDGPASTGVGRTSKTSVVPRRPSAAPRNVGGHYGFAHARSMPVTASFPPTAPLQSDRAIADGQLRAVDVGAHRERPGAARRRRSSGCRRSRSAG